MSGRAVTAILAKDLRLFLRDRFYLFITVLGLAFYVLVFWLLPATAEESIPVGLHLPGGEALVAEGLEGGLGQGLEGGGDQGLEGGGDQGLEGGGAQGLEVVSYPTSAALEAAVLAGDEVVAGLDFPEDFLAATADGATTTARVLLTGDAPAVLSDALSAAVTELALALAGEEPPVTFPEVEELVLGVDRSGQILSLREQLRPLLLLVVLLVEMFALASLVATEISQRTITAILATPARVGDVLAAKTVLGTSLAFGQAVLLAAVTATLDQQAVLVVVALLLGAVLVTGFGLMAGAIGRDFVTIVFWSMAFFVPLAIPAFAMLFPGTPALWIRALPTYGLAETLVRVTGYGDGWAEVWPELTLLLVWGIAAFVVGAAVLRRRVVRV